MTIHEELLLAFRKAVDFEKRFGYREDIPEVRENWVRVVTLIEELCRKPIKPPKETKPLPIKSRPG